MANSIINPTLTIISQALKLLNWPSVSHYRKRNDKSTSKINKGLFFATNDKITRLYYKTIMKILFFYFVLFCGMAFAQEAEESMVLNTTLKEGEMFFFGNNSVQFQKVISDSRCPKEVTCVWPGEATVLIHVYEKGKFQYEKTITVGGVNIPLDLSEDIYNLVGLVLLPYPSLKNEVITEEYVLNLKISEKIKD